MGAMMKRLIIAFALANMGFQAAFATVSQPPSNSPTPTVVPSEDGWDEIGCFEESKAGTLSYLYEDSPKMDVKTCIDICDRSGFIFAGLEGGTECHCGNIIKDGGRPAQITSCNEPCQGNKKQFCGGQRGKRILIYERKPFVTPTAVPKVRLWKSLGCWSDDPQSRALHHDGGGSDGMTVEDCVSVCQAGGYALAAVEFGLQCFCGNAVLYNHLQISDVECTSACGGDPHELCGGRGAMNLYQYSNRPFTSGPANIVQSYGDWTYLSCNAEAASGPREIDHGMDIDIEQVSVEKCLDACAAANYTVAGLQFGQECRCDNVALPPGETLADEKCQLPCNGNANEFCGGPGANLVYYLPSAVHS